MDRAGLISERPARLLCEDYDDTVAFEQERLDREREHTGQDFTATVVRLWPRLVPDPAPVTEQPSSRERREHASAGRVLSFPSKTSTASGWNPEAA
jgi:hypothetical protein